MRHPCPTVDTSPPANIEYWNTYVREVVNRYGGRIAGYELWNEANLTTFWQGSASELFAMAQSASGIISVIEVLGLVWVTVLATQTIDFGAIDIQRFTPEFALGDWSMVFGGAVLAFCAYIGFEDMVEVAEEVRDVEKTLPRAILLTLAISSVIYILLVSSTILAVGPDVLARSSAPLADVYRHITGAEPTVISFIGLFAIINGALIQVIMAARVLYGLASRNQLPAFFAYVNRHTRTPLPATLVTGSAVTLLALLGTLAGLAELTSVTMLCVFALVNFSLCRLSWHSNRLLALVGLSGGIICAGVAARAVTLWML